MNGSSGDNIGSRVGDYRVGEKCKRGTGGCGGYLGRRERGGGS